MGDQNEEIRPRKISLFYKLNFKRDLAVVMCNMSVNNNGPSL